MPKMKTVSGAKKRFKLTGSGRVKRAKAYHNHILEHKSAKRGRRLRQNGMVHASDLRQIKRMLLA
ncbi:MAG: 50S ribosomal protein L35 [Proteobacteria bacterium]|nr:50S ribosomal protein L35 [Pseudomonadota bacterium]NBY20211.1 50S ribosomal protein L35 [bacterium]